MEQIQVMFVAESLGKDWNDFFLKEPIDILGMGRFLLKHQSGDSEIKPRVLGEGSRFLLVCVGDSIWSLLDRDLTKILTSAGVEFSTVREYNHLAPHLPISKHYTLESLEALKLSSNCEQKESVTDTVLKGSDKKLRELEESVNLKDTRRETSDRDNAKISKGLKESASAADDESEDFDE